jgi:hypothetical protein
MWSGGGQKAKETFRMNDDKFAQDTSSQLYMDIPYFRAKLSLETDQNRQRPLHSNAFKRFEIDQENMENYFVDQRGRAQVREQRVIDDYALGKLASEPRARDFYVDIHRQCMDFDDEEK